uniref:Uncharacterized protein n=1 Tax=Leersia perrieri TaxID=77586 RepID=A0A0D9VZT0_9ORYZ
MCAAATEKLEHFKTSHVALPLGRLGRRRTTPPNFSPSLLRLAATRKAARPQGWRRQGLFSFLHRVRQPGELQGAVAVSSTCGGGSTARRGDGLQLIRGGSTARRGGGLQRRRGSARSREEEPAAGGRAGLQIWCRWGQIWRPWPGSMPRRRRWLRRATMAGGAAGACGRRAARCVPIVVYAWAAPARAGEARAGERDGDGDGLLYGGAPPRSGFPRPGPRRLGAMRRGVYCRVEE